MVFQAFLDDSADDSIYVLAGHIASAEQWAALAVEWERLLPKYGVLSKDGQYHFKMSEMAQNQERLARIGPFFRLIEDHIPVTLSCWLKLDDLQKANARFQVKGQSFPLPSEIKPFRVAFRALLNTLADSIDILKEELPIEFPIEFYFDEQSEKSEILSGWDRYFKGSGEGLRQLIGAAPRFEDDRRFLPLQAADFQAWWVRKWRKDDTPEWGEPSDMAGYRPRKERTAVDIQVRERDIADVLRSMYLKRVPQGSQLFEQVPHDEFSLSLNFSMTKSDDSID
ncbi:DUF3800 domain-containing protein [Brevundimonas sp.]|uniref:DUF3800 domain-containing protein n=1 Tax=Brevundimonas sp. TaxID=1871086 RepID=UPI0025C1670E|nr:DUF3800 domain-containing protein [Brevundimonas sp.]